MDDSRICRYEAKASLTPPGGHTKEVFLVVLKRELGLKCHIYISFLKTNNQISSLLTKPKLGMYTNNEINDLFK